jgi:hypothetical protein
MYQSPKYFVPQSERKRTSIIKSIPGPPSIPKGPFLLTASPLGEEEPGPEGAERGGYLPIPRRDERAGEWVLLIH